MLNLLRKNTRIFIWTIVIVFVLWGGFSVGTQFRKEGRYAGTVFGKNISFQEYERFYKANQIFNSDEKNAKDPSALRRGAWQGVILSREAKRLKINVSDNDVRREIFKLLEAQKVDPSNYENWVQRGLRETPGQFEEQVREIIRIQKLMAAFSPSEEKLQVTPEEAMQAFLRENDQIAPEIIRFPSLEEASNFRKSLKTDADWKKQKELKPDAFQPISLIPVESLTSILQMDAPDAEKIKQMAANTFSDPVKLGKEFAVFYAAQRQMVSEKDFESQKDKVIESLKERKRQSGLVQKTREVINRAALKDYMPGEPAPSTV